jgi:uncharacterized protein (TIGR02453 family)
MISKESVQFLVDLSANNNKPWFDLNRKRYEVMKADYIGLAEKILTGMRPHEPGLEFVTPKDCTFRINRDIRFSKDKSPYKTNLGIALHPGGKRMASAAYYLHIERGNSFLGGGLWMPEPAILAKVRKEIHYFFDDLKEILGEKKFKSTYGDLSDAEGKLARPPKGYEADNPAIEYLKLKSFTVGRSIADKHIIDPSYVNQVLEDFRTIQPLLAFINRGIMADTEGGI